MCFSNLGFYLINMLQKHCWIYIFIRSIKLPLMFYWLDLIWKGLTEDRKPIHHIWNSPRPCVNFISISHHSDWQIVTLELWAILHFTDPIKFSTPDRSHQLANRIHGVSPQTKSNPAEKWHGHPLILFYRCRDLYTKAPHHFCVLQRTNSLKTAHRMLIGPLRELNQAFDIILTITAVYS